MLRVLLAKLLLLLLLISFKIFKERICPVLDGDQSLPDSNDDTHFGFGTVTASQGHYYFQARFCHPAAPSITPPTAALMKACNETMQ